MTRHTPMMEQYKEIKAQHHDAILFFRLGDFYEMFFEDAEVASHELEIVLTARDGGNGKIPMCGVPYHASGNYIARLISRGYKVAVCEQVEDPKETKGLVKRAVTRIVTPGTVLEEFMLDEQRNNYLAAIIKDETGIGLAYADVSTGEFKALELHGARSLALLDSELQRLAPSECLVPEWSDWTGLFDEGQRLGTALISGQKLPRHSLEEAARILTGHFEVASLEGFGIQEKPQAIRAAALIIDYLQDTQKGSLSHMLSLGTYNPDGFLEMDSSTRRNLELAVTIREGKREGSLLSILDRCSTAMGKRMLRQWVEQPLKERRPIEERLDVVEELKNKLDMRQQLAKTLDSVYDLERLASRIASQTASPRDLLAFGRSASVLPEIQNLLESCSSSLLQEAGKMDALVDLHELVAASISEEAPLSPREGDVIKSGFNKEIDELRSLSRQGSAWLVDFESREKQRTGIKYLKVGFNKIFGYFIEVSKSNLGMVPPDYHRKQTLVNTERFINEELKNYEEKILGSRDRLYALEYEEFDGIRRHLGEHIARILKSARMIASLDALCSMAQVAFYNDYVRPRVDESGVISIQGGRHPVVEKSLGNLRFIPNDLYMDTSGHRFAFITGPNMGGKSTFMRQTALLVLMAQMGSFVPADQASIGLVDRVFTRVGAADDLAAGQSTFMVEMLEVANILNNARDNSLVILDEIGRGTSTYDGLSVAQAVSEYIAQNIKAKTLFATHYHELTDLEERLPGVFNLCVSVKETGDNVVFLKKVLAGRADKSYGLHVAQLAGIPARVILRATEILQGLEKADQAVKKPAVMEQPLLFGMESVVETELRNLDLDCLSPREALGILYKWKELI
ncbi:MAG: DNA mismatch repair protein MutS [Syntrophomonas sp.]